MMGHISIVKNVIKRGQCACTWTKSLISDHLPHGPLTPFSPTKDNHTEIFYLIPLKFPIAELLFKNVKSLIQLYPYPLFSQFSVLLYFVSVIFSVIFSLVREVTIMQYWSPYLEIKLESDTIPRYNLSLALSITELCRTYAMVAWLRNFFHGKKQNKRKQNKTKNKKTK